MLLRFDLEKVTQAAAHLLKRYNGSITRLRLLKLLYIADRELIQQTRRPLTGDKPVAMENGPVLSATYDLLKGEASGYQFWNRYIKQTGPYTHELIADPGIGQLSRLELEKLDELVQRYFFIDDFALSKVTHEFAEWKRNEPSPGSQKPIPTEHVLEALGFGQQVDEFKKESQAEHELDLLLAGAAS